MSFHNYKKNKLEQIKGFCATVECKNTVEAGKHLNLTASSISLQILSLEKDLGVKLFDRKTGQLKINRLGKEYYKSAKKLLEEFETFYNKRKKVKISKLDIIGFKVIKFYNSKKVKATKKVKKWLFKTAKYFIVVVVIGNFSLIYYLNYTNYFFDKKLYNNASSFLKNLINDGYYEVSEDAVCSFAVTQMNLDMYEMVKKITSDKKYQKIPVVMFFVGDSPLVSMRLTGNKNIDSVFKKGEYTNCNTKKSYSAAISHFHDTKELFNKNPNFKIYNLYNSLLDKCLHCNYFLENVKKYPNNLFGIATKGFALPEPARGWIIKNNGYYYLLVVTNIVLTDIDTKHNPQAKQKRHFVWKKMTEKEFMNYSTGSYWKMISSYNIRL